MQNSDSIPLRHGAVEESYDISLHVPARESNKSAILDYYPSILKFDEMKMVEQICEMVPKVEGQNDVSPLMKQAFAQALRNVSNHSYRRGVRSGFESGFWECNEIAGNVLDADSVDNWLSEMEKYAEDTCYGSIDVIDGWYNRDILNRIVPMNDFIEFAQKHWMDLKEAITWLDMIIIVLVCHRHFSTGTTLFDPQGALERMFEIFDMFRLEHSLGMSYMHDALDFFDDHDLLDSDYIEECKHLLSLETLEVFRSGVPLEDIFA